MTSLQGFLINNHSFLCFAYWNWWLDMPRMLHTFYIAIGYAFGTSTMNCRMSSSPCHCNCGTTSWSAHHVHHRMQRSCAHGWKVLCWAGQKWVELPRICRDTVGITPAALWAKGQREKKQHVLHRRRLGESLKRLVRSRSETPISTIPARLLSLRILQRGWEAVPLTERRWPDVSCDTCVLFYSEGVPLVCIQSLHGESY